MNEEQLKERLREALVTHPEQIDRDYMIYDATKGFGKAYPGRAEYWGAGPLTFAIDPAEVEGMSSEKLTEILMGVLKEKLPDVELNKPKYSPDVFVNRPQPGGTGRFADKVKFNVRESYVGIYRDVVMAESQAAATGKYVKEPLQGAVGVVKALREPFVEERRRFHEEDIERHSKAGFGYPAYPAIQTFDALMKAVDAFDSGTKPEELPSDVKEILLDKNAGEHLKYDLKKLGAFISAEYGKRVQLEQAFGDIQHAVAQKGL